MATVQDFRRNKMDDGIHVHEAVTAGDIPDEQPSVFWKAFGYMLKKIAASTSSDLSEDGQALFFADFNQLGIPTGPRFNQAVSNGQLYDKADAVQVVNHPTYSVGDRDSYYETIYDYVRYLSLQTDSTPDIDIYRTKLAAAEAAKNAQWNQVQEEYGQRLDKLQSLRDFVLKDSAYLAACDAEQTAQNDYESHLPEPMKDVARQLAVVRSANDRAEPRVNNNMECINFSDIDPNDKSSLGDPEDIYYRPLYFLENYNMQYKIWLDTSVNGPDPYVGPYTLPLKLRSDQNWASLGHPGLDSSKKTESDDLLNIYARTRVEMSFLGGDPIPFSVSRGYWDLSTLRSRTKLAPTAPQYLQDSFCKTTKLIICFGILIQVALPEDLSSDDGATLISSLPIPLQEHPVNRKPDGLKVYQFKTGKIDYPIILGVLASLV